MKFRICNLYPVTVAEGEGVGTAYEYFAKRRLLRTVFAGGNPRTILIAGLPEQYGTSADTVLLGHSAGARVTIMDEREEALARQRKALAQYGPPAGVPADAVESVKVTGLTNLNAGRAPYDLVISCDVMQRLAPEERMAYLLQAARLGRQALIFFPNDHNTSKVNKSAKKGIDRDELVAALRAANCRVMRSGYVDMPPFPSGKKLAQAKQAEIGQSWWRNLAFAVLEAWSLAERIVPESIRRKYSHAGYVHYLQELNRQAAGEGKDKATPR